MAFHKPVTVGRVKENPAVDCCGLFPYSGAAMVNGRTWTHQSAKRSLSATPSVFAQAVSPNRNAVLGVVQSAAKVPMVSTGNPGHKEDFVALLLSRKECKIPSLRSQAIVNDEL